MADLTVTEIVTRTITTTKASTLPSTTQRAASQAGVLEGADPTTWDPKNPITLFIIQAAIIIIFCRLLHWPLSKIRQPRVIAEVIGGVLLGPSVMGRIPHFTDTIFPAASMPSLTLVANLGLVLFLFLVGLEVDLRFLVKHWRVAISVGCAGMALPFGLGCAIAWGLYESFRHEPGMIPIDFPVYMLFVGVAMAITAFPVLCRILTELKLLSTPVGIIVLAAGVGNDVVGWVLLALCVALVNAGDGLTALWVLLVCVGFILFLCFAVRPVFMLILRRTRSIEDGPSQAVIALTLLIALASAFFTGIIGVHPIFGAFLAGLICPHEGGFAIKVTEKVEDLVSALFLPLYFALSGLSTNLGLLDSGKAWGYVVGVITVAFCGKMIGGSGAARLNGLVWRECFTIGSLMSCKGLVELIVLNIGLQAKILSPRTFTIFVVMALVTTFVTTPLTSYLYPPWYQQKLEAWKRGEIDWDTGRRRNSIDDHNEDTVHFEKLEAAPIRTFLVYLRLDSLPTTISIISSLRQPQHPPPTTSNISNNPTSTPKPEHQPITAHALRLLPLTSRDSSVMKVSELAEYSLHDPVVNTFLAFGALHGVATSGEVGIAPESSFAAALGNKAHEMASDLLLLPWIESGSMSEGAVVSGVDSRARFGASPFSSFVLEAFESVREVCHVGVVVGEGFGAMASTDRKTIVVPFFGTADDRVAVRLAVQLAGNCDAAVGIYNVDSEEEGTEGVVMSDAIGRNEKANPQVAIAPMASSERRQRFLSSMKASLPAEIAEHVHILNVVTAPAVATTPTFSDHLDSLLAGLTNSLQNRNTLLVLGRNIETAVALKRTTTAESACEASPQASCLGALADRVLLAQAKSGKGAELGGGQASVLVVQARNYS